jgi:hypothetical protein
MPRGEPPKIRGGRLLPWLLRAALVSTILQIRPYTRTPRDTLSKILPKRPAQLFEN